MKNAFGLLCLLGFFAVMSCLGGCMNIETIEPVTGPPGTPVYIQPKNIFGDPAQIKLKWDGETITENFCGSFIVPAVNEGGEPGKHKITIIDDLDVDEAFLIFPLFRLHHDSVTFTVTAP